MAKKTQSNTSADASVKAIKVKILLPVAGKFKLSCDVGKEYSMDPNLAKELIESGHAEEVK